MKFLLAWVLSALVVTDAVTPVQKVLELLEGMLKKGQLERHNEQVQFATYKSFCESVADERRRIISDETEQIEFLDAAIQEDTTDAAELGEDITQLNGHIVEWDHSSHVAIDQRTAERTEYHSSLKDYTETINALRQAIRILRVRAKDTPQAEALAQVAKIKLIPKDAKKAIEVFLAQDPEVADNDLGGDDDDAPREQNADLSTYTTPNAYEFKSHQIIDMMERLLTKFMDERSALEKNEADSRHTFQMLANSLKFQIDDANEDVSEKGQSKSKHLESKADEEVQQGEVKDAKVVDVKYLDDLLATCAKKAAAYQARQQLRNEELEAIQKAHEVISGMAGLATKHLPVLSQKKAVLAQLRSAGQNPIQQRAADLLAERAQVLHSRVLSTMAEHIKFDPFGKVRKMIQDLMNRLTEESNEETSHKEWCDKELFTNEKTRKEKSAEAEEFQADIDKLEASIDELTTKIAEHRAAVAELEAAMSNATDIRNEERATNAVTVRDAKIAQRAIAESQAVLKEFYAKAGEATAFAQASQEPPPIFSSETDPYKGMQGDSVGVLGILEVIQSDFARLEADTSASEKSSQAAYDEFMTDSQTDKAVKTKDLEHFNHRKQDMESALIERQEDLATTQKQYTTAMDYYDKLKPSCVDVGESYEDRVHRREQEIESLELALRILNGDELPPQ